MKSTIGQQKEIANYLLRTLSAHLKSEVYLAGGMLRDHFLEQPGNDYDFYYQPKEDFDHENFMLPLLMGLEGHYEGWKRMIPTKKSYGYISKDIHAVYEGQYARDGIKHNLQVIVLEIEPRTYIESHFCCSLSKCWKTKEGQPMFTEAFLNTIQSKKMNFNFSKFDSINYNYMNKILSRYPQFDVDDKTKQYYLDKMHKDAYWKN